MLEKFSLFKDKEGNTPGMEALSKYMIQPSDSAELPLLNGKMNDRRFNFVSIES